MSGDAYRYDTSGHPLLDQQLMIDRPVQKPAVVLLTSQLGVGGAERHTVSLANLLGRRFAVILAHLKAEASIACSVDRTSVLDVRHLHAASGFDLSASRNLVRLCDEFEARVVVCANPYALIHAQIARLLSRNAIVVIQVFHATKLRTLKD